MLGLRSGSRIAAEYVGNKKWRTVCDCGREFVINGSDFRRREYVCNHVLTNRFFGKISFDGSCWLWSGSLNKDGYGNFRDGEKTVLAHIFSWVLKNGTVPHGKELDHLCRNRKCVNPEHLEPVTHAENVSRGLLGKLKGKSK